MIVAGARCEQCARIDTIPYTAVKVMLGQKGWKFNNDKCVCPICLIKYPKKYKNYQ